MLFITPRELACSQLFEQHRLRKRELLSMGRTPTQTTDLPQELLSRYREASDPLSFLQLSVQSSKNTPLISDTPYLVTVHSFDGHPKASFFGTSSQLVPMVSRYLTTGTNTPTSPKRSRRSFRKRGSSSASSELLPKNTLKE